jgi:hypothetical protein
VVLRAFSKAVHRVDSITALNVTDGLLEWLGGWTLTKDNDHPTTLGDDPLHRLLVFGGERFHAEELGFGEECGERVVQRVTPSRGDAAECDVALEALELDAR